MIDMDAAIGFVVARGDEVDRARLSWLRAAIVPPAQVLADAEAEVAQAPDGGWPALWGGATASVDATCFRLGELDDLGALGRPPARRALAWLAASQQPDGTWEEDPSLAGDAPPWATPGDPEARFYLTAAAAFWLTVAELDTPNAGAFPGRGGDAYAGALTAAARALVAHLRPDGTWPSFLAAGWLGAAVLHRQGLYYESARIQGVLTERLPGMSAADLAWMAATLHRVGIPHNEWIMVAARHRLAQLQRSDGGWPSDDGDAFDVHTTLRAIRACR